MSKKISMATTGGGYVVVYITPTFFYSGQSLSDGKDQSFSAKACLDCRTNYVMPAT